jgi:hypothetical protein
MLLLHYRSTIVRDFGIVTVSEAFRFEIDGWELAKGLDI